MLRFVFSALALTLVATIPVSAVETQPLYHVVKTVALGAPDKWDYVVLDGPARRVYVAHGTEINVVDADSGELVGKVPGIAGAHGIGIVSTLGRGYAANGDTGTITVFDLATLKTTATIKGDLDADPIIYDKVSNRVFVMNGDAHSITVIDPVHNTNIATIALPGKPEYAAVDDKGNLFVNIMDQHAIAHISIASNKVTALWSLPGCEKPHGLTIDAETNRLFSTCANGRLAVVSTTDGAMVADIPIGRGSDAAAFDPIRRRIFSANGEGTLSIIQEKDGGTLESEGVVTTKLGARTMAVDPTNGRVFIVAAEIASSTPRADGNIPKLIYKPGSVSLLMLDP